MLQRPFFTAIVIAFWSVTTGWLMVSKILPAWQPGLPPGQQALYASDSRMLPVAWSVACNDQPIGWALTRVTRSDRGGVFVDSRLHFDRLPWDEMLPGWATLLVRRVIPEDGAASFDARGRLAIDEEGSLRSFSSVANLPGTNQPLVLTGTVDDGTVTIHVVAGEMRYEVTRHLPTDLMIGDELSPQATMPGLTEGRRWTLPSYSPLRAGGAAIEILHAEVGGEETIYWEDQLIATHVVKYREDPSSDREPRARLWVDRTGRVLRQETSLLGAKVAFVRMPDDAAVRLAAAEGGAEAVTTGRAPFPSATAPEPSTP
jgi:hypothetical protein